MLLEPTTKTLKHDFGNFDYKDYLNSNIHSDLAYFGNFYTLYTWRINCLNIINLSNKIIVKMQENIEKYQRIVDGIKLI